MNIRRWILIVCVAMAQNNAFSLDMEGDGGKTPPAFSKAVNDSVHQDMLTVQPLLTSERAGERHPRPWRAALEVTGINLLVHGFDRFVMGEEFAKVNLHTIHENFKNGFVWDNDQFSTNLFAHPYHGNLYYTAARSNGLSFFQSAPYALGGSLMWEFFGEIEPPAINDVLATTFGGICIGEISHRISDLLLDDRKRGFKRFLHEFAATVICPMKGLNRMIDGDAWRVRRFDSDSGPAGGRTDGSAFPVNLSLSLGNRYLADDGALFRGEHNPYLNLSLEYGDPIDDDNNKPYDYFTLDATLGFSANQPLFNGVHLLGRIWSATSYASPLVNATFGIYQHFNYYDSKPVKEGSSQTPYRISEAASVGPGVIYQFPVAGSLKSLEQRIFFDVILLGGTKSDYYNIIDRDYNMGSGFSIKSFTTLKFRHVAQFMFKTDYYRIFTWKGYEGKDLTVVDPLFLNAQGDRGNAELLVLNPRMKFYMKNGLSIDLYGSYYVRHTRYKYHTNVRARTFEVRLGLSYAL